MDADRALVVVERGDSPLAPCRWNHCYFSRMTRLSDTAAVCITDLYEAPWRSLLQRTQDPYLSAKSRSCSKFGRPTVLTRKITRFRDCKLYLCYVRSTQAAAANHRPGSVSVLRKIYSFIITELGTFFKCLYNHHMFVWFIWTFF